MAKIQRLKLIEILKITGNFSVNYYQIYDQLTSSCYNFITNNHNIEKCSNKELPTFKKLWIKNTIKLASNERQFTNEFFNGSTPVPPNYLEEFHLEGCGDMLLLYIDKLVYTVNVVTTKITIENFTIDESTFSKFLENAYQVKQLHFIN